MKAMEPAQREPRIADMLVSQILNLIEDSGASFGEANAALKAAHALLQSLPLPISARSRGAESDAEGS
jgi:hypothetical protein